MSWNKKGVEGEFHLSKNSSEIRQRGKEDSEGCVETFCNKRKGKRRGGLKLILCLSSSKESNSIDASRPLVWILSWKIRWLFGQFASSREGFWELPSVPSFILEETLEDAENEGTFDILGLFYRI